MQFSAIYRRFCFLLLGTTYCSTVNLTINLAKKHMDKNKFSKWILVCCKKSLNAYQHCRGPTRDRRGAVSEATTADPYSQISGHNRGIARKYFLFALVLHHFKANLKVRFSLKVWVTSSLWVPLSLFLLPLITSGIRGLQPVFASLLRLASGLR